MLVRYNKFTSSVLNKIANYYKRQSSTLNKDVETKSCGVCDNIHCKRHKITSNVRPWKDLLINVEVNAAIEKVSKLIFRNLESSAISSRFQLYNRILTEFVASWHKNFTNNSDFLNELRYCLRYSSASIVNRFAELNIAGVISSKLLPCIVRHIDDHIYMQQFAKMKQVRMSNIMVEYLGKRLHYAATNRKNELKYLQECVSIILPSILPEDYLHCGNYVTLMREILAGWVLLPLMDVLADPNIINSLLIYSSNTDFKLDYKSASKNMKFLNNFVVPCRRKSLFFSELCQIKKDVKLLYVFMQYLKRKCVVHLLQFCLDVGKFQTKRLDPQNNRIQI